MIRQPQSQVRYAGDGDGSGESEDKDSEELRQAWRLGKLTGQGIAKDVRRRFVEPRVDDPGLVVADTLVAGVVTPGVEVLVALATGVPLPHWVDLGSMGLVGSVLYRGVTLAACFVTGAFAAECYDRKAYDFPGVDGRLVLFILNVIARAPEGTCRNLNPETETSQVL